MKHPTLNGTTTTSHKANSKRFALLACSVLSLALLITACQKKPQPQPVAGETATVELGLEAMPLYGATTKAAPELTLPEETKVYNLWVVQFNKATSLLVGEPAYVVLEAGEQIDAAIATKARMMLAADPQTVYCIANTHNDALLNITNCASISTLNAITTTLSAEYIPTAATGLPMLAIKEVPSIVSGTSIDNIQLERLVAKVKLRYKANNSFPALTVTSVKLCNIAKSLPLSLSAPTGAVNYPAKTASSHFDYPAENLASAGTDGDYKTFTWYIPENLRKAAAGVASTLALGDRTLANTDDQMVTYVQISGTFINEGETYTLFCDILLGNLLDPTNGQADFNVKRNTVYNITADLLGPNAADHRISLIPPTVPPANAFMVVPGSKIVFNAKYRGNETTASLVTQSIAVLWQDVSDLIPPASVVYKPATGIATVLLNPTVSGGGNAVIAAYSGPNATGTILWSWHIWATDYQPNEAGIAARTVNTAYTVPSGEVHSYGTAFQTTNGANKAIMDRNLGAGKAYYAAPAVGSNADEASRAYGLMFEWGRKDPFRPAKGSALTTSIATYDANGGAYTWPTPSSSITTTINDVIQNPTTFYRTEANSNDWLGAGHDDALWGNGAAKSLYDPCPNGWRVPSSGTWGDFTRVTANSGNFLWWSSGVQNETANGALNGRLYTTGTISAWYPAAGMLTGNPSVAGEYGYCWSSSCSDVYATYLVFWRSGLMNSGGNDRGLGIPVRCVQE